MTVAWTFGNWYKPSTRRIVLKFYFYVSSKQYNLLCIWHIQNCLVIVDDEVKSLVLPIGRYIAYVFDTKYCGFSAEIEYASLNCYARRDMNFVLYKEFLNPCRLKRLKFTFHLFHKFSIQDKGSHAFISKGNNLATIAQCKFKTFLLLFFFIITLGVTIL